MFQTSHLAWTWLRQLNSMHAKFDVWNRPKALNVRKFSRSAWSSILYVGRKLGHMPENRLYFPHCRAKELTPPKTYAHAYVILGLSRTVYQFPCTVVKNIINSFNWGKNLKGWKKVFRFYLIHTVDWFLIWATVFDQLIAWTVITKLEQYIMQHSCL